MKILLNHNTRFE